MRVLPATKGNNEVRNLSRWQMVGIERAMMLKPDTQAGAYICGSDNITSKLAQGWIIIPSDRNNILPERIAQAIPTPSGMEIDTEGLTAMIGQDKPKRGRPRKDKQ